MPPGLNSWVPLLVAATAGFVSLLSLFVSLWSNRRGEAKNKLRDLVAVSMHELGPPLFDVVASTSI